MLVAMGAWVPSCLLRECWWADVSAMTINGCCSHLVPLLGSLFYPLANGEQLDIGCLNLFHVFVIFWPPPSPPHSRIPPIYLLAYAFLKQVFQSQTTVFVSLLMDQESFHNTNAPINVFPQPPGV